MSDDKKTREQLLAELEALNKELEQGDKPESAMATTPALSAPLSRRALSTWVAPVILSLPVLGTVLKSGEAQAQVPGYYGTDDHPIIALPTMMPTARPTLAPAPTRAAAAPTKAGRCIPVPTAAPTLGMGAAPDCRPSPLSLIALGSARALASGSASALSAR